MALARPEWRTAAVATALLFLGTSALLAYPQGIRLAIDAATQHRSDRLAWIALGMLGIAIVQSLAAGGRSALFGLVGHRIATRLREQLYRHLLEQEIAFFDRHRTGELTSRLASDTAALRSMATLSLSVALRHAATAAGGVGLLLLTSPALTAVMLAIVPPIAVGAVLYGRRIQRIARETQDALADANAVAEQAIGAIRTVRSFGGEPSEAGRYGASLARAYRLARSSTFATARLVAGGSLGIYGSAALVLWYGGTLLATGRLTAGQLTSFLVYTLVVAMSLSTLADEWAGALRSIGAVERVFDLLDRAPEMPAGPRRTLPVVRGVVALEGVSFRYPARPDVEVLHDVDLTVSPGEVVALVGPSGAGKSTIAALLTRLYDPQRGTITLDGIDLRELDPRWFRRHVAVVSQEPVLFATTIRENISYARPAATPAQVELAATLAHADAFITALPRGYETKVGERGVHLSGGQRQRIAIARALLKDAPVLLLDEATSALDAESEGLVRDALATLAAGRATLVIAHRLSTVTTANRLVVLDAGRIVQVGKHEQLVRVDGPYRRIVERQLVAPSLTS